MNGSGRLWSMRVTALVIALILWFILSFERRETQSERQVQAAITYMRGDDTVILEPRQAVDITISGPRESINRINPFDVSVQVDLRQTVPGFHSVNLTSENVSLPQGLRVDSIQPSTVAVTVDQLVRRELPVEATISGEPAAGATRGDVEVVPPTVVITGPASHLRDLRSLRTANVSLEGRAISFEESVAVLVPDEVAVREVQPAQVSVRVPLRVDAPGEPNDPPRRPDRRTER